MQTEQLTARKTRSAWWWIPTLYVAEGLPYALVMQVSGIMYKRLGISNVDILLYTSLLGFVWVIKPLWSPFVDIFGRKRTWILATQLAIGVALGVVALALSLPYFFAASLTVFWIMAFGSATHDIAADGFYMLALPQHLQAAFVGVRSTFYRIAMILGQGAIVVLAGSLETFIGDRRIAWTAVFAFVALIFPLFALYHRYMLPSPPTDHPAIDRSSGGVLKEFLRTFVLFFRKKGIVVILLFLLFFRFAEMQLVRLVPLFLLDPRDRGGLGLSTSDEGIIYGTVGIIALTLGGLAGGYAASRGGLKRWLWPMVLVLHLPDLVFIYLSQVQPESLLTINAAVVVEQFGYGFGFTAYMLFMMMISEGEHRTAHYAICTGFMALGQLLCGVLSGFVQEAVGYKGFFLWILLSTVPGFIVAALAKIDPEYGKKREA